MLSVLFEILACGLLVFANLASAQTASTSGYVGYNLTLTGDEDSVVYATDDVNAGAGVNVPDPDVYLNASVHVGTIDLQVDNLTAKINLDAQVLSLLTFNAGVDLSISKVRLLIENVNAKVLLEARLENLVRMINDTLASIDLNPVIATLGQDVSNIVNTTVGGLTSTAGSALSSLGKRDFDLANNIVYSVNNYAGDTHTNRVLAQNGDLVDQYLDNEGRAHGKKVVGSYKSDMRFNGYDRTVERNGKQVQEREYTYSPYHGINVISAIFTDAEGTVVGAQVLAESSAGGSSSVGEL
ncbi:hypothetical protein LTR02_011150 [Friedmanniomyces endolithicus]|nr:hypothetical protein LTR94_014592 [Friedmanniomyces endolithicus]KAK0784094.1 hypothetical protein LTR38_012796 [Friedmanniomyces endolithicus]KAK0803124.1 hypothetical protein LTR75_008068 [Friedmanniomyces endolithicus]KAK0809950.1 hypothetical protein LTR59_002352 [Friedmanniomyces endolithicus]KAK0846323.1 hypothetical protein LTR03_006976 [Friedmanniomyces endolithicus]